MTSCLKYFMLNFKYKMVLLSLMLFVNINIAKAQIDEKAYEKEKTEAINNLNLHPQPNAERIMALRGVILNNRAIFLKQKLDLEPYASELLVLSKKLKDSVALGIAYEFYGFLNKSKRNYAKAIIYLDSIININQYTKDINRVYRLNCAKRLKGVIYNTIENYTSSLTNLFESLTYFEQINDDKMYDMYGMVAEIYAKLKNYPKAIKYYELCLTNKKALDWIQYFYSNKLIEVLLIENNFEAVKQNLDKQILFLPNTDSFHFGSAYKNKGIYFYKINQLDSANYYFNKALLAEKEFIHSVPVNEVYASLGKVTLLQNKLEEAKIIIDLHLQSALTENEIGSQIDALQNLSSYYEKKGNFIEAYNALYKSIYLKDSLFKENVLKENNALSVIYETEKIQNQAIRDKLYFQKKEDSLQLLQANTNAALQKESFINAQQKQNLLLQSKELLLNKQNIITSNQKLSLLNKDKELQHLAYLKTQADLQSTQLAKQANDKTLSLTQSEKQNALSVVKTLAQKNENNILRRKQLIGYGLAGIATLLFGVFYFFTRKQNKQLQVNAQLAKEKAEQALIIAEQKTTEIELQKNISDITLSALRSQMNPHFIFNSLNSINSVVIQGNIPQASDYLTKFSKLIRLILENSKSNAIPISKELEALNLYLLMEKIRFQNKFEYQIQVDENINADKIFIPPTTLQPFVENAILHGIMHLNTKGILKVNIKNTDEHFLEIVIDDNGVGRTKALELKSRTNIHQSHGYQITKDRIMQLHRQNNIVVLDKVNDAMQAIGTTIVITLHY
jgi:sensor histidine kinase YesM